jgi:hypothetical protein
MRSRLGSCSVSHFGAIVDWRTYVTKLSSSSFSVGASPPLAAGRFENPFASTNEASSPLLLVIKPPADFTSQHLTDQSAPPLTSTDVSCENAKEYIVAVCPVIFFTRFPVPRSQRLMAKSSPEQGVRRGQSTLLNLTCTGEILSVWTGRHSCYGTLVTNKHAHATATLDIPKTTSCV